MTIRASERFPGRQTFSHVFILLMKSIDVAGKRLGRFTLHIDQRMLHQDIWLDVEGLFARFQYFAKDETPTSVCHEHFLWNALCALEHPTFLFETLP